MNNYQSKICKRILRWPAFVIFRKFGLEYYQYTKQKFKKFKIFLEKKFFFNFNLLFCINFVLAVDLTPYHPMESNKRLRYCQYKLKECWVFDLCCYTPHIIAILTLFLLKELNKTNRVHSLPWLSEYINLFLDS
jgi:hypothetical protein